MKVICGNCFHEIDGYGKKCPKCGYNSVNNRKKFPMALPDGAVLAGRYIIGKVLGQGGFGITYLAQDYKHHKLVAVKEYLPVSFVSRTKKLTVSVLSAQKQNYFDYGKENFLKEAKTLAVFGKQEHVPSVHCYFEENGTAYFVMDYIDGIDLREYLKNKGEKLSWEETCRLLLPIARALEVMHQKDIIHRDIKPENIVLDKQEKPYLLDFGAARYSTGEKSMSLSVVLTSGYAPVEQYSRKGKQGAFTDVYALAATMYRCLTGKKPPESIERIVQDTIEAPSALGAKLPKGKGKVLRKALAVTADKRYQNMVDFVHDIEEMDPVEIAYHAACKKMEAAKTIADFEGAIADFEKLCSYKDCVAMQEVCLKEIQKLREEEILLEKEKEERFSAALKAMTSASTLADYEKIRDIFKELGDFRDSNNLVLRCEKEVDRLKKKEEKKKKTKGNGGMVLMIAIIVAAAVLVAVLVTV